MFNSKLPSFSFSLDTQPDYINTWQYLFLGVIIFFGCFYGLGSYPILDMNEGLYAEIAREMLVDGHWIIPHLNGVVYLEKPPLLYWLLAFSYHLFGVNAFAARLVPSSMTALTILGMVYWCKKIGLARVGWLTGVILGSSVVFLIIGRTVFFDPVLLFCISACLISFYLYNSNNKNLYLYTSFIFLGLSVLAKSFVTLGLIPLIIVCYLMITKADKSTYKKLLTKNGLIVFLIITLPWHILGIVGNAHFLSEYVINQQILRFFNLASPHDYHTGPWYFYIPRILAYVLPWSIFLVFLIKVKLTRPIDPLKAFLYSWFLVIFIFFSLSSDKGDYYCVLAVPPLACLIALKIEEWIVNHYSRIVMVIYPVFTVALLGAGLLAILQNSIPALYQSSIFLLLINLIIFIIGGLYLCLHHKQQPLMPFLLLGLLIIPLIMCTLSIRQHSKNLYSQKALVQYIKNQYQNRPVYLYQHYDRFSSFVFYAGFTCPVVDSRSADLYFGSTLKQDKGQFISQKDFGALIQKEYVYLVIDEKQASQFKPFCAVSKNGHTVLLSNAPEDCQVNMK